MHTEGSPDAHTRITDLPRIVRGKNLDGVAITEHDSFTQTLSDEIIILPGVEVSSAEGHIVALGVHEIVPKGLTADSTIKEIHDQGGLVIVPHPYDPVCECVRISRLQNRPDAVETRNADALSFTISSYLARRDARNFGLPEVGGSDAHIPQAIGDCYTVIDSVSRDAGDILAAIKLGRTRAEGHATSMMNKWRKLSYKFR